MTKYDPEYEVYEEFLKENPDFEPLTPLDSHADKKIKKEKYEKKYLNTEEFKIVLSPDYFNIQEVLTHKCLLTFILGIRGIGKTYSTKAKIIKDFRTKGWRFVYARRLVDELSFEKLNTVFEDFPDLPVKVKADIFYMGFDPYYKETGEIDYEWREFGYAVALSQIQKFKGTVHINVKTFLYDEFVSYNNRYLPDEGFRIFDMIETFCRMDNDIRFIACGNYNNDNYIPVFEYFNVGNQEWEDGKTYKYNKDEDGNYTICIHVIDPLKYGYTTKKKTSRLAYASKGTNYYSQMIKGIQNLSNKDLVKEWTGRKKLFFVLKIDDKLCNLYNCYDEAQNNFIYIGDSYDKTMKNVYNLSGDIHGTKGLKGYGLELLYKHILDASIYFETRPIMEKFINVVKLMQ